MKTEVPDSLELFGGVLRRLYGGLAGSLDHIKLSFNHWHPLARSAVRRGSAVRCGSAVRAEAGTLTGVPDPTRSAARGAEREHRHPARCGAVTGPAVLQRGGGGGRGGERRERRERREGRGRGGGSSRRVALAPHHRRRSRRGGGGGRGVVRARCRTGPCTLRKAFCVGYRPPIECLTRVRLSGVNHG